MFINVEHIILCQTMPYYINHMILTIKPCNMNFIKRVTSTKFMLLILVSRGNTSVYNGEVHGLKPVISSKLYQMCHINQIYAVDLSFMW